MSTPQFPAEVLEQIVPHLADDPISLSICCLSSRVFVPACRVARFQSITLEEQEDSTKFHALLESSPTSAVTRQVKSLTIIDPQLFNYKKYRDAVTGIFDHLRTVIVHLQIFNKMENYRIHWPHLVWLQDGISELSLQSFGTEDWNFAPKPITPWPCSGDDAALGLFDLPSHVNTRSVVERLRLSAFRLSHIRGRPVQKYLDSGLLKWLDFSRLRALAFCTRINDTPDSTGTYLSALIQPCSASLEYLVFEPKNPANDLELPLGGCPRLKRLTIIVTFETKIDWDNFLLPWAEIFLDQCPSLRTGEITFSLMSNRPVPTARGSMDPGRLLVGIEELKERFPTCLIIFAHPYRTLELEEGIFPPDLVIESRCTYIKFWSRFYLT